MSEPNKQPEIAPIVGKDVTPANDAAPVEKTTPAAAANTNGKTDDVPAPGITPVVDVAPKKEPLVTVPAPTVAAPAVEAPVNDNAKTETTAPAVEAPKAEEAPVAVAPVTEAAPAAAKPSRAKGFLKGAFNFAVKAGVGAAVTAGLKTAAVVGAGIAGAPAWATILIAGVAVGMGSVLVHDAFERRDLKKQGVELAPYFSKAHAKQFATKKTLKTFGISTVAAIAGSMLFMGFHEGIIQNWWNHLTGHAPAAVIPPVAPAVVAPPLAAQPVIHPVAPVAPIAPVVAPIHCATTLEQFSTLTQGHHVSKAVEQALHRVSSTNPRVHVQALKDLGYYAQNGFGGVPKDHNLALQLFKQAADGGNLQGKVDMVYLQHYGLDGIHADKAASLSTMKGLAEHSHRAAELTKAWAGAAGPKAVVSTGFNSNTIVQGMKLGCGA